MPRIFFPRFNDSAKEDHEVRDYVDESAGSAFSSPQAAGRLRGIGPGIVSSELLACGAAADYLYGALLDDIREQKARVPQ